MAEFNEDGSLKLPERFARAKKEKEVKLRTQRCMLIRKEVVNDRAPKKCVLKIRLSDFFKDNSFVAKLHHYFSNNSEVLSKLKKINEKEFEVEIGTCFRRCSDCSSLVKQYKDFLDGNVIEEKGSCTYERRQQDFCYEDYFD